MRKICRYVTFGFAGLYLIALALFAIGTIGLFGNEPDPLSGVVLIPLGLPWVLLIDKVAPEPMWVWLGALAPVVNLIILFAVCRWLGTDKR